VIRYALRHGWSPLAVALDLFLVLIALRFDLHLAWTVPEFLLPLAVPTSPDAILALDLPLELVALRLDLHSARLNSRQWPTSFKTVRFEDLVASPQAVMRDVSRFLGIQYTPSLTVATELGLPYKGNSFDGKQFDGGVSGDNVGSWRHRISPQEAMII
jgi:hypothetical protein